MKKLIYLVLLLFSIQYLGAQIIEIQITEGAGVLCAGECSTYYAENSQNSIPIVTWSLDGNVFSTQNPVQLCFDEPATHFLSVINEEPFATEAEMLITVLGSSNGLLESNANVLCPSEFPDDLCEKVCVGNEVTYTLPGVELVTWQVNGSNDYIVEGNSIIVDWNEAGEGSVTGVGLSTDVNSNFSIDCGMLFPAGDFGFGSGFVYIQGGIGPFTILVESPGGPVSLTGTQGQTNIEQLFAGTYDVLVVDQSTNQSQTCTIQIADWQSQECFFAGIPYFVGINSSCNLCNGGIEMVAGSQEYTVFWSNGTTTNNLTNLCAGIYTATVTDNQGCEMSFSVSIEEECASCSIEATTCVEILEEVESSFTTIPNENNGLVTLCEGQEIGFLNQSLGGQSFVWNFGDGNNSIEANPSHLYQNPGTYQVSLLVFNECFCADTSFVMVEVIDADIPEISCLGTVCKGETVTYNTTASCTNFNWSISGNGTIGEGGGSLDNFVTVTWDAGPNGLVSLQVNGCMDNVCTQANIQEISILSDNAIIQGPDQVCNGTEVVYSIQKYDGTSYQWEVSNAGQIIDGQGSHEVIVEWSGTVPSINQEITVNYSNCYLECGGSDSKFISILPEYYISGHPQVCQNSTMEWNAFNNNTGSSAAVDWQIINENGMIVYSQNNSSSENIEFNFAPGDYSIIATPSLSTDYCNDTFDSKIEVLEIPSAPNNIEGETLVCIGSLYNYTASSNLVDVNFNWTIIDGSEIYYDIGSSINVTWNSNGPYQLNVTQIATEGLDCESESFVILLNQIPSISFSGDQEVCPGETTSYVADLYDGVDYQWSITPESAGSIISQTNNSIIEIYWNHADNASISLSVCNELIQQDVLIHNRPNPTLNGPEWLCQGATAEYGTTSPYNGYQWYDEFGILISNIATPILGVGYYNLEVADNNGCINNMSFEIKQHPVANLTISSPNASNICISDNDPFPTLYAENTEDGFDYEWYHNDVSIGNNNPIFSSNDFGEYYVIATDINGCAYTSNTAFVIDHCGPDSGGGQCSGGGGGPGVYCDETDGMDFFDFENNGFCNTIEFTPNLPGLNNVITWYFDDGTTSNDQMPNHNFYNAGFYKVAMYADLVLNGSNIQCLGSEIITIPVAANFDSSNGCSGEPIDFTNVSTFIPGESIVDYSWDFGDALSPNNNSSITNPNHIYSEAGNYTVNLTITSENGCISEISKLISVWPKPEVDIDQPNVTCAMTAIQFQPIVDNTVTQLDWDFGDPQSGNANVSQDFTPYHTFSSPGNYIVTLTATSIYGCSDSNTLLITVDPNNLSGNISIVPSQTLCEGESATLSAPFGGVEWLWSNTETTSNINTTIADVYYVDIVDGMGCQYRTPSVTIDINPLPSGDIFAVTYDDFGIPIDYQFDTFETCEGEDVFLEIENTTTNTFLWSSGSETHTQEFSAVKGNLLSVGTHNIEVIITNNETACSNTATFSVIVHPTPNNIVIISDTPSPICANGSANLIISNPQSDLNYIWNNGETSNSINIIAGGEYFVTATSTFGCQAESNHISINNAPNIDLIPDGCHERCQPDSICLPNLPNVAQYQWYFEGNAIPQPEGNVANFIVTESGIYTLDMTDIYGCTVTSDPLGIDLYQGTGNILGNIYFDINENGIIDPTDTLVNGVDIIITDMDENTYQTTSDINGNFLFENVLSTIYDIQLDTTSIDEFSTYHLIYQDQIELIGCDEELVYDWLLIPFCPTESALIELTSCDGAPIIFDNIPINAGQEQVFNYNTINNCDSIVTVSVINGFTSPQLINEVICPDDIFTYNGIEYTPGSNTSLTYINQFGCDSIIQLQVDSSPQATLSYSSETTCVGQAQGSITFENVNAVEPYQYSLDGSNFSDEQDYDQLFGGEYTLYLRDGNDCIHTFEAEVLEIPELLVEIPDTEYACGQDSVRLTAITVGGGQDVSLLWQNGDINNFTYTRELGSFSLLATDECATTEYSTIVQAEIDTRSDLFAAPNIFSPNNDGANDYFTAFQAADITVLEFSMMIFDRWGNQVFHSKDVDLGWNGQYNGDNLNQGVYTYKITAKVESCKVIKEIEKVGDVTLVY